MSINLPTVDLTGKVVGNTGSIQLPQPKVQEGELAYCSAYNESGCGLAVKYNDGQSDYIPAGAWHTFDITSTVTRIDWTVSYVLPNAPVNLLSLVYYFPGEEVHRTPALGNSPIGVTGSVSTSSVQTLSNEGNASNTLVIDMGDTGHSQLYTIYTDGHSLWQVDQSGTVHQVLKIQVAGNPLQLGQAADITEVLGNLTVDGTSIHTGATTQTGVLTAPAANILGTAGNLTHILGTLTVDQASTLTGVLTAAAANILGTAGNLTHILGTLTVDQTALITGVLTLASNLLMANNVAIQSKDSGATARAIVTLNASNQLVLQSGAVNAQVQVQDSAGTINMAVDGGGLNFTSKKLFDGSANNLADWSATGLFLKGNPAANGKFNYQGNGANSDFTLAGMSTFTGAATGTFNHLLKALNVSVTPDLVLPMTNVVGSQTMGYDTLTATQVHVTVAASLGFKALAMKF